MKKLTSISLCAALITGSAVFASADARDTYVSMGADLTVEQRAKVLELMDLTEDDLADMDVVQITNEKEHEMLGGYLPNSVIGSRALSCVRVDKKKSDGIQVTTKNITYCTEGMYQNALITAGIENADVIVAGPTNISGTAGLVGAMEAYQELTGKAISEENKDAAVNEIVATGNLADDLGSAEDAENLMALVKQNFGRSEQRSGYPAGDRGRRISDRRFPYRCGKGTDPVSDEEDRRSGYRHGCAEAAGFRYL